MLFCEGDVGISLDRFWRLLVEYANKRGIPGVTARVIRCTLEQADGSAAT